MSEQSKSTQKSPQKKNDTAENAIKYSSVKEVNTYYLGFRDLPNLFKKYDVGISVIDYGCGTGRSTRYLSSLGFSPIGVDISEEMLLRATSENDELHYLMIQNGQLPFLDNSYDFIFSSYVFFTVPTRHKLSLIFEEAYRCLKKNGYFIFVTGSKDLYSHDWLSYDIDFPDNVSLKSGDQARIYLKDLDIEFVNYLWTDADYEELATASSFTVCEKLFPKGLPSEKFPWKAELEVAPYVIFVLQKT